jgi:uncharacterized membrane protein
MLTRREFLYLTVMPLVKIPDGILTGGWYQDNSLSCAIFSSIPLQAKGIYTYAYIDASQQWLNDFFEGTRELFECQKTFLPIISLDIKR